MHVQSFAYIVTTTFLLVCVARGREWVNLNNMKKYIAEGFGTFCLALAVGVSLASLFPVSTPVIAALTLGLLVYTIGTISGTHINPAVTIGLWSLKKISTRDAGWYIIAQFIGAALALFFVRTLVHPTLLPIANTFNVFLAELVGTFFFTFGIAAVVYEKVPAALSGIVVGGSLLLGISLAAPLSNGILNPAVAWGIGSFSVMYVLGPIVGSLLGMNALAWLIRER